MIQKRNREIAYIPHQSVSHWISSANDFETVSASMGLIVAIGHAERNQAAAQPAAKENHNSTKYPCHSSSGRLNIRHPRRLAKPATHQHWKLRPVALDILTILRLLISRIVKQWLRIVRYILLLWCARVNIPIDTGLVDRHHRTILPLSQSHIGRRHLVRHLLVQINLLKSWLLWRFLLLDISIGCRGIHRLSIGLLWSCVLGSVLIRLVSNSSIVHLIMIRCVVVHVCFSSKMCILLYKSNYISKVVD